MDEIGEIYTLGLVALYLCPMIIFLLFILRLNIIIFALEILFLLCNIAYLVSSFFNVEIFGGLTQYSNILVEIIAFCIMLLFNAVLFKFAFYPKAPISKLVRLWYFTKAGICGFFTACSFCFIFL